MNTVIIDTDSLKLERLTWPNGYLKNIQKVVPSEEWVRLVKDKLDEVRKLRKQEKQLLDQLSHIYNQAKWLNEVLDKN